MRLSTSRYVVPIVLAAVMLLPAPSRAQRGLEIVKQEWDSLKEEVRSVPAFSDPELFQDAIVYAWRASRPDTDRLLEKAIGDNNSKLPKGVTLYQQKSTLSDAPVVSTRLDGDNVVLRVELRRNLLICKSTTPTVLGSYADPKFSVDYDVVTDAVIPLPDGTRPLKVQSVKAIVENVHLDSQNFPADVLKAVNSVVAFFNGPNFKALAERQLAAQATGALQRQVDARMAKANAVLADLSREGFTMIRLLRGLQNAEARPVQVASLRGAAARTPDVLTLLAYRARYEVPTVGPGEVRGSVYWPREFGRPPVTDPFVFSATIITGPDPAAADGPRFDFRPRKALTPRIASRLEETATGYVYHYTLHDLPYDVPFMLTAGLRPGVNWAALNPQPLPPKSAALTPTGWDGRVLIRPAPKITTDPARIQTEVKRPSVLTQVPPPASSSRGPVATPPASSGATSRMGRIEAARETPSVVSPRVTTPKTGVISPQAPKVQLPVRSNPEGRGSVSAVDFTLKMVAEPVIR